MNDAAYIIGDKYSQLTDKNVLELLKIIEPLEFAMWEWLVEEFLVQYFISNFSEITMMEDFGDLFGTGLYNILMFTVGDHIWTPEPPMSWLS